MAPSVRADGGLAAAHTPATALPFDLINQFAIKVLVRTLTLTVLAKLAFACTIRPPYQKDLICFLSWRVVTINGSCGPVIAGFTQELLPTAFLVISTRGGIVHELLQNTGLAI